MSKELRKVIYTRSRLINIKLTFIKNTTKENGKRRKYEEIDGYLLERKVLRNILRILSEHDKTYSYK